MSEINKSQGSMTETSWHYLYDWYDYDRHFNLKLRQRPLIEPTNIDKLFIKMRQEFIRKLVENKNGT